MTWTTGTRDVAIITLFIWYGTELLLEFIVICIPDSHCQSQQIPIPLLNSILACCFFHCGNDAQQGHVKHGWPLLSLMHQWTVSGHLVRQAWSTQALNSKVSEEWRVDENSGARQKSQDKCVLTTQEITFVKDSHQLNTFPLKSVYNHCTLVFWLNQSGRWWSCWVHWCSNQWILCSLPISCTIRPGIFRPKTRKK